MLQVGKVQTTEELCILLDTEEFSFRFEFVFSAPSSKMTLADKVNMVRTQSLHYLIYANQAEIDQLVDIFYNHLSLVVLHSQLHLQLPHTCIVIIQ